MSKPLAKLIALLGVFALLMLSTSAHADDESAVVFKFRSMVGNHGPYIGAANPIRGINAGGLPWVITRGSGSLSADGWLRVRVKELIIPASSGFGNNPAPYFKATVSCLTIMSDGTAGINNVSTTNGAEVMIGDPTKGNARIREKLNLPNPCLAPIVFVTSPGGAWFAVDAVQAGPDEGSDDDSD